LYNGSKNCSYIENEDFLGEFEEKLAPYCQWMDLDPFFKKTWNFFRR
jgi:hypothetical protein